MLMADTVGLEGFAQGMLGPDMYCPGPWGLQAHLQQQLRAGGAHVRQVEPLQDGSLAQDAAQAALRHLVAACAQPG